MQDPFSVEVGSDTDPGRVRGGNEDYVVITTRDAPAVQARGLFLAVADGMGGHAAGDVASRAAAETAREAYYTSSFTDLETSLRAAFRVANERVYELAAEEGRAGMGTTLTVAVIQGNRLLLGHVGDTRAYVVRGNQVRQLTSDHSWVQEQIDEGAISAEQAKDHPQRNLITRALGQNPFVDVDIRSETLEAGDWVLLCSDGLFGVVADEELPDALDGVRPQAAAEQLVALANSRGAPDNISVVLARLGGPAAVAGGAVPPRAPVRRRSGGGMPSWVPAVALALLLVLAGAAALAMNLIPLGGAIVPTPPTPIVQAVVSATPRAATTPAATVAAAASPTLVATPTVAASPTVAATPAAAATEGSTVPGMDPSFTAIGPITYITIEGGACARPAPKVEGECPAERLVFGSTAVRVSGQGSGEARPIDDAGNTSDVWYYGELTTADGSPIAGYFHSSVVSEAADIAVPPPAGTIEPTAEVVPAEEGATTDEAAAEATPEP